MLAPDATRASLDLVIYHPWIKPYRSYLLEIYQKPKPTKTITPESHKKDDKKKKENFIKKAFLLIIKGPFPPPTHPYRDLAHLGTRESVFLAAQRC
jgi:hypothetical protein